MSIRYCICKTRDGTGFMLQCERCDVWFHGRCVGITEKQASKISRYFCDACREKVDQCANADCVFEARKDSKYCSDECGYKFNEKRYARFFPPKWRSLEKDHSTARLWKMKELEKLENEKEDVIRLIGQLKTEKEELEETIAKIKERATELRKQNTTSKERQDDDDVEVENEENEEVTSGDQSKTFCIICGSSVPANNIFKHWSSCHRKQESNYNFTSDVPIVLGCATDTNPKLYCQRQDKKSKRYCMHIESACPQHSNWQSDKDEVCGCPINIMQKLVLDENYCLELRNDCTLHHNWDRFRLASKNMERVQAFSRLEGLIDKIARAQSSLNDTYGGVIGVMKHNTIDHNKDDRKDEHHDGGDSHNEDIDVAMLSD